jgi:hypothetical protein
MSQEQKQTSVDLMSDEINEINSPYDSERGSRGVAGNERETKSWMRIFRRNSFPGTVFFNVLVFLIPALYATLSKVSRTNLFFCCANLILSSKLWIAQIDSSMVATTDYLR